MIMTNSSEKSHAKIWDLPVRVFHWTLVLSVLGAFITNRLGVSYFKYHVWFGYGVIVAVSFRILWGIFGSHHAQFHNFVRGPKAAITYALSLLRRHHLPFHGHNPLGAVMVVVLLIALAVQAGAGLFGNDQIFNVGPLAGYVSSDDSLTLTSLHRRLFWGIAGAVGLHLGAVLFHTLVFKENLVKAMITGHKPLFHLPEGGSWRVAPVWLAVILCIGVGSALAIVIKTAPAAEQESASNF